MKPLLLAATALLGAGTAAYSQVPPVPAEPINANPNIGAVSPSIQVCYNNTNSAYCGTDSTTRPGLGNYFIPLSSFVYTPTTDQLRVDVDALRSAVAALASRDTLLSAGVAMAAASDAQLPGEGQANRLGVGIATFNDETAMAVTYGRRQGPWDGNLALATSSYEHLAKASVGYSW